MRLLIVSNRLPINLEQEGENIHIKNTVGGLATGLNAYLNSKQNTLFNKKDCLWIGWPGSFIDETLQKKTTEKMIKEYNYHPVFLSEEEINHFYKGFCNQTIWPLFHYFPDRTLYENTFWNEYKNVNNKFLAAIESIIREDDIIWIQDYHLFLLPNLIRQKHPLASIGFFLHIPFPSYEIFSLLSNSWRKEILTGLLGADVIGFHTYDYVQNFMRCVLRILGHENSMNKILLENRLVKTDCFPMNIDFDVFFNAPTQQPTINYIKDTITILSVDRLDYTKGIIQKLKGFDLFLMKHPFYKEKVTLTLIIVPSRSDIQANIDLKVEIEKTVHRINTEYGTPSWMPVCYSYKQLEFNELVNLYSNSPIALITSLRDGMNLVAKEYIASKKDKKGVLILSEMAGASNELLEAIIINPYNTEEISEAIYNSLQVSEEEQINRNTIMQDRLRRYDVTKWVDDNLNTIQLVRNEISYLQTKVFNEEHRLLFLSNFLRAKNRIFLLDYDGTLVPFAKRPELAKPGKDLLENIKTISEFPNTKIVILTGRDRHSIENWFKDFNIDFAAEHGIWIKEMANTWQLMKPLGNSWKIKIRPVLEKYREQLPGSFIEEKEYALVWHYRIANPEQSQKKCKELIQELINITSNSDIQIMEGIKALEIRNAGINKGTAAMHWLSQKEHDFIVAIGDDITDEDLFKVVPNDSFSIKVGIKKTEAQYTLTDTSHVSSLLRDICKTIQNKQ